MADMRSGSRYELQRARKGVEETKAAGDYYAVHPGDIEEIAEEDDLVGMCIPTRSAAPWTDPACASSPS